MLMNVITQPLLWHTLLALGTGTSYLATIGVLEILVWLVEAALLHLAQRKTLPWGEALGLSFLLNAASFGTGLLLPM